MYNLGPPPRPLTPSQILTNTGQNTTYGFVMDSCSKIEFLAIYIHPLQLTKSEPSCRCSRNNRWQLSKVKLLQVEIAGMNLWKHWNFRAIAFSDDCYQWWYHWWQWQQRWKNSCPMIISYQLAMWAVWSHSAWLSRKWAAAINMGQPAAANPVTNPQLHTHRIVSAATLHAVFVERNIPASILVDTGLAVTNVHCWLSERGQLCSSKLQPVVG